MTISLEKLNYMYQQMCRQVRQLGDTTKSLKDQFQEDTHCDEYENPFDTQWELDIENIKGKLARFLIYRYQATFCPNIPVSGKISGYEDWFPENEFDAVEFVNRINAEILPNDPERIAYETLLRAARGILLNHDKVELLKHVHRKVLRAHAYVQTWSASRGYDGRRFPRRVEIAGGTVSEVAAFETFAQLILDNQSIFTRVAPTQIKARTPVCNAIWNDKTLPQTVYCGGPHIKEAAFFKNGRIDFHFKSADECRKVALALAGDEPDVHFPKHEINMNQLFQPPDEGPRRVVRMKGA